MKRIPLFDVPRNTVIRLLEPLSDGSTWMRFHRIDGTYSLLTLESGNCIHLGAVTEIGVDGDGGHWFE